MAKTFCITNAKIVLLDRIIPRSSLVVKGKKIAAIHKGQTQVASASTNAAVAKINAQGNFVAPGFIDLHIHGEITLISRQQARGGTTGFLATLHPQRPRALLQNITRACAQAQDQNHKAQGAKVLGIRLEGPFLNREFCGALAAETLRVPDIREAKRIINRAAGTLKMVVVAPELKGALPVIRLLKKHRIIASMGHSGASYEQAIKGIAAGITHATHTFNRMRPFDHCCPGALGAALTDNRLDCEVICDGIHVHPAALGLLLQCKGTERTILITDSTAAQRYPAKRRKGLVFRLKDGTLYGTALTLNKALKNAVKFLGLSLVQATRLVTINPARVLKIDRTKGSLAVGKDADIVIFDQDFNVKLTMVEGKLVFSC